ncbi:MAG: phosphoribosylanthranilate isomerase [Methylococcus sp.]|jgi:phosphoribosylanthranilate isomerase|nr:MAG: phosphoribosylanthranilate isomerase [Methylococcus sp.]
MNFPYPYPSRRTRVKICGLTRIEDALAAVRLGADALGLVFYPESPRVVSVEVARSIIERLPPFITIVGLFVNEDPGTIADIVSEVRLDLLQFHGDETEADCQGFGRPFIKAIRMRSDLDLPAALARFPGASGFLVDAFEADAMGGTGRAFDWGRLTQAMAQNLIVAGGLRPDNVTAALKALRPYALDVSSGVEAQKGIKDEAKMAAFLSEVHDFDYRIQYNRTL